MQAIANKDLSSSVTLRDLKEGDRADIEAIQGKGAFKRRLLEMGFIPGTSVFIKKYAPLRDPIEFVVKGYHVSLRREEAQMVSVRAGSIRARKNGFKEKA